MKFEIKFVYYRQRNHILHRLGKIRGASYIYDILKMHPTDAILKLNERCIDRLSANQMPLGG